MGRFAPRRGRVILDSLAISVEILDFRSSGRVTGGNRRGRRTAEAPISRSLDPKPTVHDREPPIFGILPMTWVI